MKGPSGLASMLTNWPDVQTTRTIAPVASLSDWLTQMPPLWAVGTPPPEGGGPPGMVSVMPTSNVPPTVAAPPGAARAPRARARRRRFMTVAPGQARVRFSR